MPPPARMFEFRTTDDPEVLAAMADLSARQQGWITLQPGIPDEGPAPEQSLLGRVFSGLGPPVPLCTWVAPQPDQRPPHAELGIQHGSGPKAVHQLEEAGAPVPDWGVVLADHPKRGLVVAVHPDAAHRDVLAWLLTAGGLLSRVRLTGSWRASVFER